MDFFLAALAGVLVIMSMSFNSALSRHIGVFQATTVNYVVGLAGVALIVAISGSWRGFSLSGTPWWTLSGGLLGVIVVSASNVVIPRIPVLYVTVLLFFGQLAAGILIDTALTGSPDALRIIGALLVLAGLGVNMLIDRR